MRNKKTHAFKMLCLELSLALFLQPVVPVYAASAPTQNCAGKSCPAATATVVVSKPVVVNKTILANKLKTIKPASVLGCKSVAARSSHGVGVAGETISTHGPAKTFAF